MTYYEMDRIQLDIMVRDGTSACEARLDFVPMASVEGDFLKVFHGVRFSSAITRFRGTFIRPDSHLNDLSARLVERLDLEGLGGGLWRRPTSPRTALAALDGYEVEVVSNRLHEALWSPEILVPKFTQTHLIFMHLMMGVLSVVDGIVLRDEVEDIVDRAMNYASNDVGVFFEPHLVWENSPVEKLRLQIRDAVRDLAAVTRVDASMLVDV